MLPEPVPSLGTSLWNLAFSLKHDGEVGKGGQLLYFGDFVHPNYHSSNHPLPHGEGTTQHRQELDVND